jgi:hypothetical protein
MWPIVPGKPVIARSFQSVYCFVCSGDHPRLPLPAPAQALNGHNNVRRGSDQTVLIHTWRE